MPTPNPPSGALTVLVVDDDADTAESLAELLALHGYAVRTAFDGEEALCAVAAAPPDVVLLDVRMPGMDGCEVARLIRERCAAPGKRPMLVAVTGCGADDARVREAAGRFDLHLVKPVDPAVLVGVMGRFRRLFSPPAAATESEPTPDEESPSCSWLEVVGGAF